MSLNNPDSRRAMRSIVQAVIVLALVGLLAWLIYLLSASAPDLSRIAMALCGIVGLYIALVGAENVGRVMVEVGAAKAEIGDESSQRGQDA